MIILSQNRNSIVNLDNIINIHVENDYYSTEYIIYYETETFKSKLGKYSSIERCKEILEDILSSYQELEEDRYHIMGSGNSLRTIKCIYKMPEE